MAGLNGISAYSAAATVTSVGAWVKVAEIKGSDLPSGTGPYAFVALGTQCEVFAPTTNPAALMEVGLGDDLGVFPSHVQSLGFVASPFFRRKGVGFQIVLTYDTGGRGNWNSSRDLVLWARINANNGGAAQGGFVVSDVALHAFDLTKITTTVAGNVIAVGGVSYGGAGTGSAWNYTSLASFPSNDFKADRDWLVFSFVRFSPDPNSNGMSIAGFRYRNNKGTIGSPGTSRTIGGDSLYYHGRGPVGLTRSNAKSGQSFCTWCLGAIALLSTDAAHADPDIQCLGLSWWQSATSSRFYGAEFVAIDVTDLEDFDSQFIDYPIGSYTNGLLDQPIMNDGGVTIPNLATESHESTRGFDNGSQFVWQGRPNHDRLPGINGHGSAVLQRPYHSGTLHEVGKPLYVSYCAQYHSHLCSRIHGYEIPVIRGTAGLRANHFFWGQQTTTGKHNNLGLLNSITSVVWNWANNPNKTPDDPPAIGATIPIHPGYEAYQLASLVVLPTDPTDAYNERDFDPKERLETDLGYETTWPRFAAPRVRMTLRWSGLTILERDALALFFADEDQRAFKWDRPGYGMIALVALGPFVASPQGNGFHSAQLDALEVLYLGGTP